jgi:hypothetical protein
MIPYFTSLIDKRTKADSKYYTNRDVNLIEQGTIWNDPSRTFWQTTEMMVDLRKRSKNKARKTKLSLIRIKNKVNRSSKDLKRVLEQILEAGKRAFPNDTPQNPLQPKSPKTAKTKSKSLPLSQPKKKMWEDLHDGLDQKNGESEPFPTKTDLP